MVHFYFYFLEIIEEDISGFDKLGSVKGYCHQSTNWEK